MENKKQILSMQLNVDDFAPASDSEKESLSVMRESVSFWKDGLRRLRKNPIAMVSLAVLIIVLILAFIVPAFYPYDYATQIRGSENLGPMQYSEAEQAAMAAGEKVFPHILGTDSLGRDYAVRVMMGTRVSLSVGLLASVLVLLIGSVYGSVAGFLGGKVDLFMMRIVDIIYTVPDLLIIILLMALIIRLFYVAYRASTPFSALIAVGVGGMLLFQTFMNIFMNVGLLPVMGLTLPFFSYGGTSIVTMFAALGIAAGVRMREKPSWLQN